MKSFGFSRRGWRSTTGQETRNAEPNPARRPDCGRLQAERAGLQARIDAIEPLCTKWRSLVHLNQVDASGLIDLEAHFGTLAPRLARVANGQSIGRFGKGRGVVAEVQATSRKQRLQDVEKLRVRADVLSALVTSRSEQIELLARRIGTARAALAPRVERWNRATERGHCAGPPLDLYPTVWPSFAPWSQRDIAPENTQDSPNPDLVDYRCEGLSEEISQHNRRVGDALPANRQLAGDLAELEGKLEALRQLAADVRAQWLSIKNELVWREKMWVQGDRIGYMLSSMGLATVLDAERSSTAAGFGEALFELSNRQCGLQSQIDAASSRLNYQASRVSDQIRLVAEPLRTQAIELEHKLRHCRQSDLATAATGPAIHRLSLSPPGNSCWVRAQNHLQRVGTNHLTAEQITYVLNNARTW